MSAHWTVAPVDLLVSIAYWSIAESSIRRSSRTRVACERLRARRKFGTAIAARRAMMATTIMISTRVNPPRFLFSFSNIGLLMNSVVLYGAVIATNVAIIVRYSKQG